MQLQETLWTELSRSSQEALRWAAAMARLRADRAGRPLDDAEVDEDDLLVGIMLSHPGNSEPRQLLAHVGATAADVLPPDYPAPGKDLERYGASGSDQAPRVDTWVTQSVEFASSALREADGVIGLKALFGGLLAESNRLSVAFRALLERAGLASVIDAYAGEYLRDPASGDLASFLARAYPYRATPVEIPNYKADAVATGDDLVDIRAEVDAFAYLLASRSLTPPLAVGLFGDWGSGKTFFMESVQERIGQLVGSSEAHETPQNALPFWKQIVQINFNAWHYVKGDLLASLVEHVFSELRVTRDENDSELAKRQKHWLEQIEAKRQERSDVLGDLNTKKSDQETARRKYDKARETRHEEEQKLAAAQANARADVLLDTSKQEAQAALARFADGATEGTAGEALDAIGALRAQLQRAPVAIGAYPWTTLRTLLAIGALLAVPLLVYALSQLNDVPVVAQAFAGVSAALGIVAGAARSIASWTKARLDTLAKAEAAINADIRAQQGKLDAAVAEAAAAVAAADEELGRLSARDGSLEREIEALQEQARSMTSGQILGEFVAERVGSTDYRQLLGTTALIQRDFDALSKLIDEQNEEFTRTDTGGTPKPETLNRIILYIDDLDRCEPERVIDVLQAVHLLLAFPLFVVVVAVDARWLAHALEDHYPALTIATQASASADGVDEPSPSDYLEKIFQVPFWIEPLGDRARRSLVRGMLQGNLATADGSDQRVAEAEPLQLSRASEEMLGAMFGRSRAVRMQTAALSVTPAELTYLDELAPLLGNTPRSIKRFVNVYQLLCALPVPPAMPAPLYEQAVAFFLAISDGLPRLSAELSVRFETPSPEGTLADAVAGVRASVPDEEMTRYDAWAQHHAGLADAQVSVLVEATRRVSRFSFR